MVFEELTSTVTQEVEEGESEITQNIFDTQIEPIVLSAGQVADFTAQGGNASLTAGPYIYDINGNAQRWIGNKWFNEGNFSDYIEIGPESQFGAYFEFPMTGEYTTTFSLKYANE